MWAGIEIAAAIVMFFITRQVIGPLEKFKLESCQEEAVKPEDVQMKEVEKK